MKTTLNEGEKSNSYWFFRWVHFTLGIFTINGILLLKLFWPTVRKNCSSNQEKTFGKFVAWEDILHHLSVVFSTMRWNWVWSSLHPWGATGASSIQNKNRPCDPFSLIEIYLSNIHMQTIQKKIACKHR